MRNAIADLLQVVLVVAAPRGIQDQTIESIKSVRAYLSRVCVHAWGVKGARPTEFPLADSVVQGIHSHVFLSTNAYKYSSTC